MGLIYIENEGLTGDKLPQLATLYLLALKLIYDEQMESISTSVNVYATLGPVSYTHLDVYKRQSIICAFSIFIKLSICKTPFKMRFLSHTV